MENEELELVIKDLTAAHDEYLAVMLKYQNPEECPQRIKESKESFESYKAKIQSGELNTNQGKALVKLIRDSTSKNVYPKGSCSTDCLQKLLSSQYLVITRAFQKRLSGDLLNSVMEISNELVQMVMMEMVTLANDPAITHWEARDKIHDSIRDSVMAFVSLSEMIQSGTFHKGALPNIKGKRSKETNFAN